MQKIWRASWQLYVNQVANQTLCLSVTSFSRRPFYNVTREHTYGLRSVHNFSCLIHILACKSLLLNDKIQKVSSRDLVVLHNHEAGITVVRNCYLFKISHLSRIYIFHLKSTDVLHNCCAKSVKYLINHTLSYSSYFSLRFP